MADTLLRELSNTDLDWMITHGERSHLSSGNQLLRGQTVSDVLCVLIDGKLGLKANDESLASSANGTVVDELGQGEIVGLGALFGMPEMCSVETLEASMVMSLSTAQVKAKLEADIAFAAHFYRAIAIMLSSRLRRIFEQPGRIQHWGDRASKEVLSIFAELRDSDIDWLVSFGETQIIPADKVLLQAARPVDALYVLLDGQMAISAPQEDGFNPLYLCFSGLENSTRDQKAFATLTKGGMPGIISFLDFRPLPVTIRAVKDSLVFAIPRQTLVTKLQVDDSFASRFYRVIAIEILERLYAMRSLLRHPQAIAAQNSEALLDEELDLDELTQMSEGAKKFNWMLSQLGVA
ncbi:cyclic nucleotide-binding domain-containing protein [Almyronema epifaneia]|uniref:Cyclic nucleotide-binding domain-containing protein n=1 Tax=Almyronema epifaneia S1 TaxID=2991925 RepID=A0ABW6IJ85_9CYAN